MNGGRTVASTRPTVSAGAAAVDAIGGRRWITPTVVVILLLVAALLQHGIARIEEVNLPNGLQLLAAAIDGWVAGDLVGAPPVAHDQRADESLLRSYVDANGARVTLDVTYYRRQSDGHRVLAATQLEPPGGWIAVGRAARRITPREGRPFDAATLVMRRDDARYGLVYWYQLADSAYDNVYVYRFRLLLHSLVRRRSEGTLVKIAAVSDASRDPTDTATRFAAAAYPVLTAMLPR